MYLLPSFRPSPRPAAGKIRTCGLALFCLLAASSLNAALIVDWGGAYVSANQALANPGTNQFGGFSGGNPLQLSPAAGYSGGLFYGVVAWGATGLDGSYGQIVNNASTDRIEIKRYNADLSALFLWRKADFLNGMSTGPVTFDSTSKVSMNLNTFVQFDPGRVVIRLSGGSQDGYYISQETPFNGTGLKEANLTALTWRAYNPATDLDSFGSTVNLLSGGLISNVAEIGFYTYSNASSANAFRLDSFEVTAIPEPTAATLFILSSLGFLALRRRP